MSFSPKGPPIHPKYTFFFLIANSIGRLASIFGIAKARIVSTPSILTAAGAVVGDGAKVPENQIDALAADHVGLAAALSVCAEGRCGNGAGGGCARGLCA